MSKSSPSQSKASPVAYLQCVRVKDAQRWEAVSLLGGLAAAITSRISLVIVIESPPPTSASLSGWLAKLTWDDPIHAH